jgi:seryl-tRNA(Sec) selenium transferase
LPLVDDLAGRSHWSATSRRLRRARAGADLVCFSGDKFSAVRVAGIVVGQAELVERPRRIQRALRADKPTLAASSTLALASTRHARPDPPNACSTSRSQAGA